MGEHGTNVAVTAMHVTVARELLTRMPRAYQENFAIHDRTTSQHKKTRSRQGEQTDSLPMIQGLQASTHSRGVSGNASVCA
jgi:hypothetical protein